MAMAEEKAMLAQPQSREARLSLKLASLAATAALMICSFSATADAQDHVCRWRIGHRGGLLASEVEGTDDFGRLSMSCLAPDVAPETVEITVLMRPDQLGAFGALVSSHAYPRLKIDGDPAASFLITKLEYTEFPGGWQYSFSVSVDAPVLDRFEQTGTLNFEIEGGIKDGVSLDRGLDAIAEFRSRCRREKKQ